MNASWRAAVVEDAYARYFRWRRLLAARSTPLPPAAPAFSASAVRRVLLVCSGLVGDTVMCLPAIAAARSLLPGAELCALVNQANLPLLQMADVVDTLIVASAGPLGLRSAARRETRRLAASLEGSRFDLAVVFLGDDFAPMLAQCGIPHRLLARPSPFASLATATYDIGGPRTWGPQERCRAWLALGLEPPHVPARLRPRPEVLASVASRAGLEGRGFVAIHPFGRTSNQRWPLQLVRRCMDAIASELGLSSVVVGICPRDCRLPVDDRRFRLVDKLTLEELVAVLQLSSCVVSTDSGPLHLAGVLQRPGAGLFRRSRPEHAGRYPTLRPIVAPELPLCHRCAWDRCRHVPCRQMAAIAPDAVVDGLRGLASGADR